MRIVIDSDHTLASPMSALVSDEGPLLGLTILWHPERARIGQQCMGPQAAGTVELNRFFPSFGGPGELGEPLGHRCVARSPVLLRRDAQDGLCITPPDSAMTVHVNGALATGPLTLSREQVARGVVLGLGGMVLVCVHWMRCMPRANELPGLLGVGSAAVTMREQVRQVASSALPVLLLGETGTGKDVAARAIHNVGILRKEPFVAVNMAALNESLAAADLFGAEKGAYTGSLVARTGYFGEADGGTLFLDEIGDTPAIIQPMLLRVLETGEYRPLGARSNLSSTVRLITATDRDLSGRSFNQALLRRMEGFVIRLPALRQRREDIGVLIRHFLEQEGGDVELPFEFLSDACNDDWPGNIRQLGHVLRRAVLAARAGESFSLASFARIERIEKAAAAQEMPDTRGPVAAPVRAKRHKLTDFSYEDVAHAMAHSGGQVRGAAQALGISRPSLYKLLDAYPEIRRSGD